MSKHVIIFTDGACRGNPGPGGWGALLRYGSTEKEISGAEKDTTNNRMEVTAAIEALNTLKSSCVVDIYTDSQYLQKGITEWLSGWKKRNWKRADKTPVKNVDLWMKLDEQVQKHEVRWHWVKGHSGHVDNDRVDLLATDAINKLFK